MTEAARALFLERGYAATTIGAISARSDVPEATLYRLFSSKLGILAELLDLAIAGDDEPLPLEQRPQVRALLEDPDPARRIAGAVAIAQHINMRGSSIYAILVGAAASDVNAAELLDTYARRRQQGQGQVARSLAQSGALRPDLREQDAADIIHALMSPELYRLLVIERDWPPDRYRQWLTTTLIDQLLPPPPADRVGARRN